MFPKYEHRNTPIYISHRKRLDPCPIRFHSHMEVLCMMRGHARITIGSTSYDLEADDLYLVFPNVPHGIESADGSAVVVIADPTHLPGYQDLLKSHLPQCPVLRKGAYPAIVSGIFDRLKALSHETTPHQQSLLTGYTGALLGELLESMHLSVRQMDDGLLQKLILYFLEHYTEDISLESVAKGLGYSRFYISRLISTAFGCNFRTLLANYRISMAQNLLVSGNRSIGQIAEDCGFKNQSSFNRIFLEHCGITPGQYRKKLGPPPEKPTLYIRE